MKFAERISWGRRAVVELRGIRHALEHIADQLGASVAPGIAAQSAFRSFYDDQSPPDEDALAYMEDEDRLVMEQRDLDAARRGGPAVEGFYEGEDDRVGSVVGPTVAGLDSDETGETDETGES